ncbi:MAG: hypothetical protein EX285_05705 [Thaumarchaeota archaeon]|nr:hypothetical protein [Nitrososphaerota archaeon]
MSTNQKPSILFNPIFIGISIVIIIFLSLLVPYINDVAVTFFGLNDKVYSYDLNIAVLGLAFTFISIFLLFINYLHQRQLASDNYYLAIRSQSLNSVTFYIKQFNDKLGEYTDFRMWDGQTHFESVNSFYVALRNGNTVDTEELRFKKLIQVNRNYLPTIFEGYRDLVSISLQYLDRDVVENLVKMGVNTSLGKLVEEWKVRNENEFFAKNNIIAGKKYGSDEDDIITKESKKAYSRISAAILDVKAMLNDKS